MYSFSPLQQRIVSYTGRPPALRTRALAFEQLSIGEEEIRQNGELEHGLVSIGASENALRLILLEKLELFREQYPHVRLRLFNHSTPQAVQALKNYAVDFAIVTTPISIRKPLQKKKPPALPGDSCMRKQI